MPTINQLSAVSALADADQIPIYAASTGDARRVPASIAKTYMQSGFVPSQGMLSIAPTAILCKTVAETGISLTTSYQPVVTYDKAYKFPGSTYLDGAFTIDQDTGYLVAQRDLYPIEFWATLTGEWSASRELHMAVIVGPLATPQEVMFKALNVGRGTDPLTLSASGLAGNITHTDCIIKADEYVFLGVKTDSATSLDITQAAFGIRLTDYSG